MRTMFDSSLWTQTRHRRDITAILKLSDKVLLVTVLSLPSLINVKRLQSIFRKLGYRSRKTWRSWSTGPTESICFHEEAEETSIRKLLGIPNDYRATMSAINQGKPLGLIAYGAETRRR